MSDSVVPASIKPIWGFTLLGFHSLIEITNINFQILMVS